MLEAIRTSLYVVVRTTGAAFNAEMDAVALSMVECSAQMFDSNICARIACLR